MAPVQQFTIPTVSSSGVFTLASGTRIMIPADGLLRADGVPVANGGPIQVAVREVRTRSEMIFNRMFTVADNGQLLESAGMSQIRLSQGSVPLTLAPRKYIRVVTLSPTFITQMNSVQLFTGTPDTTKVQVGSWAPVPTSTQDSTRIFPVQTGFNFTLGSTVFNSNTLGWINCDRFINATPTTSVRVLVNATGVTSANTQVYLVFSALNAVTSAYQLNPPQPVFVCNQVPEGYSITAVVVQHMGTQYYFGKQAATITANLQLTPPLRPVTETELVNEIKAL